MEKHGTGVVVRNAEGQLVWALEGYVVNVADYDPKQLPSLRDFLKNEGLSAEFLGTDFVEEKRVVFNGVVLFMEEILHQMISRLS